MSSIRGIREPQSKDFETIMAKMGIETKTATVHSEGSARVFPIISREEALAILQRRGEDMSELKARLSRRGR